MRPKSTLNAKFQQRIMKKMKLVGIVFALFLSLGLSAQPSYIYEGGNGNGYSTQMMSEANTYLLEGNPGDGYACDILIDNSNYLLQGGGGNGYVQDFYLEPFVWTGAIGTGWTVQGNWNYNVVPGIYRPVIIPAGVANWPFLNAGLFNIGDNPNNGAYKCASLWIQRDALLVTRVNNRVENYGAITIDGEMQVKNQASNAFQNIGSGLITITGGGGLTIKS